MESRRATTHNWPDTRARKALLYVVVMCVTVVVGLGVAIYDSVATFSVAPDIRHSFLGIPIDALPLDQLKQHHGARFLVILGEPQVFVLVTAVFTAVAWLRHDRRLAYVAAVAPITAEILTEMIAKPGFHRMAGVYYTYPSGHVTASASLMAVLALMLRRLAGRKPAALAAPLIAAYVAGSMAGVVILHMHDMIDAVGGLATGVGVVSLWTLMALEWRSGARTSAPTS